MGRACALGIDIGGTKTMVAAFDPALSVRAAQKFRTRADRGADGFLSELDDAIRVVLDEAGVAPGDITGVGMGVAGRISDDRTAILDTPNIPFLPSCDLAGRIVAAGLPAPVFINDCQAALLGEQQAGAAKTARNAIGVFVGTGVGAALIVNGVPYLGSGGIAGNIGRFRIDPLTSLAGATRHGYVDDACSRTALASEAAALVARHYAPYLAAHGGTDVTNIRSNDLRDAIDHGDDAIAELVRSRMRLLGLVLCNMVDFLNPDLVVLGGGVVESMPDLVREEVKTAIREHATPSAREHVKVAVAKLAGHAVTTGACHLALAHAAGREPPRERSRRPAMAA